MEIVQLSFFEKLNNWIKESITVKLASIGFLVLILLIPQSWIESLMRERQARAEDVVNEISAKWSTAQTITGPVLVIPFLKREKIDKGKDGIEIREWTEKAFFLPEQLKIEGKVDPEIRRRGIFEAVVYGASLDLGATFSEPDFAKLNIADKDILWKDATLMLGISDLRGISGENPNLKMGTKILTGEPSSSLFFDGTNSDPGNSVRGPSNGIVMRLPWKTHEDFERDASMQLNLRGSSRLYFSPVGKTTDVKVQSDWPSPSFDGEFLPANSAITGSGFAANWKVLHYNRPFSQQWTGDTQKLTGSEFGVRLLIPVDQYQKSIRTAKYGILVILLTFISLFMVEIMRKVRIHPFQYILVGAALIVYYTLVLSLSEHLGYNLAYGLASAATVALVTLYSSTFFDSRKLMLIFSGLLAFFYAFIFVIIQMEDYSLLLGSIGLFLIVGLIMYFSKSIKWYGERVIG